MIYKDISLKKLIFAFFDTPVQATCFNKLETNHLHRRAFRAEISIIGESHLLQVQSGQYHFTESVFCGNERWARKSALAHDFCNHDANVSLQQPFDGLFYCFNAQVHDIRPRRSYLQEILRKRDAQYKRLQFSFPNDKSLPIYEDKQLRSWLRPYTIVDYAYDSHRSALHVRTYHIYPNEAQYLETESIFKLNLC